MAARGGGVNRRALEAAAIASHVLLMAYSPKRDLDMASDGSFRAPLRTPWSNRIILYAVVTAVVAGAVAFAAFALWIALMLIPVVLCAVLVVVVTMRVKLWQARRGAGMEVDRGRSR